MTIQPARPAQTVVRVGSPRTKRSFGNPKLDYDPLPFMDEYFSELVAQVRSNGYILMTRTCLGHFTRFIRGLGIVHPEEIERRHLLQYQAWVSQQDWRPSYKHQMMKMVRTWLNWLEGVEYITKSPWVRIKIARPPKQPNPLSEDDLHMLFEAHRKSAFRVPAFTFHRREVILTLLYAWGLRVHELHALNVSGVDARLDFVTAINKGGGTKSLPYDDMLKFVINRWLRVRSQHALPQEDALLVDTTGARMSIPNIRRIVVQLGEQVGIKVHPHQLRDTCGTALLNGNMPVERAKEILGHTNIQQTLAYSRVNNSRVAEDHTRIMTPQLSRLIFNNTGALDSERER